MIQAPSVANALVGPREEKGSLPLPLDGSSIPAVQQQNSLVGAEPPPPSETDSNSHPPQETYPNGDPMYVDDNGDYVNSDGQRVDQSGNPVYLQTGDESGSGTQVVYYDDGGYYWEYSHADGTYTPYTPDERHQTANNSTYEPIMGEGEPQPVYDDSQPEQSYPAQMTYWNGTPMYTDSEGNLVNSSGQCVDKNGNPIYVSTNSEDKNSYYYDEDVGQYYYYDNGQKTYVTNPTLEPKMGSGEGVTPVMIEIPMNEEQPKCPYDPSAPDSLFDPDSPSGSDVLSKSYLFLEWMQLNPSNTNGAEVFLLYTNNLAAAGYFGGPEGNALSDGLLSIKNSEGKTLVAECVDITMEQMILTGGYTSQTAAEVIYDMFDDYDDPVSEAVCNEAAYQGGLDPETGEPTGTPVMNDQAVKDGGQDGIEDEWNTFMTDPATVSSIDDAQCALMCGMIDGCGDNVYLALLAILMLLEATGILKMDTYADLSNELADETNELNLLITEWSDGSAYESPEAAEEWMNDLQDLQEDMDATPFDDATHELIDQQFQDIYDVQAMGYNSNPPQETYANGDPMYVDDNGNYVNSDGQRVDENGNTLYTQTGKDAPSGGQTVYYNPDTGEYYPEGSSSRTSHDSTYTPQWGVGEPQPVYDTSGSATSNPAQVNYSNGMPEYTDSSGNSVNSSGQKVNEDGYPLYTSGSTTYYYKDGTYYNESTDQPATGTHSYKPVMGSGEDVTPVTTDSNALYVDSTGQTYYKQDDGTYVNADTGVVETPTGDVEELTIGDQAFGITDENGNTIYEADPEGLQASFEAFQPQPVDPDNPNSGGFSSQDQEIINSLNALTSPLSQQTAAVGAEMQQTASWIELVDNTFSATLLDDSGFAGTMSSITDNMQA